LNELSIDELKQFSELVETDVFERLSLNASIGARSAIGGTSPERVNAALDAADNKLKK